MRLAILDLGTNSIKCDIFDIDDFATVKRVYREKKTVRLGDQVFLTKRLDSEAKQRVFAALEEFAKQIAGLKVDRVLALATSAMRFASDGKDFLKSIKTQTGISFKIISGEKEAKLIAKGILSNGKTPSQTFALVDIGGGSTEVSFCHKRTLIDCFSLEIGAIRAQQIFLKNTPPKPSDVKKLREEVRRLFSQEKRNWPKTEKVIGSSGTIRAIRKIIRETGAGVEPYKAMIATELVAEMQEKKTKELLEIQGMDSKRVDIVLAGAIILDEVLSLLGAKEFSVTGFALRDGILEDQLEESLSRV